MLSPSETDLEELRKALAEHAATQSQLEALQRIGRALHEELELERIVQRVTEEANRLCRAEFGAFFYNVIDPGGERYTLYTLAGVPRDRFSRFPMPRNTAVFGPTFRGECVVRLDDVTKDPRYGKNAPYHGMPEGHLPVCSYLAVPVVARSGEVLGGLFFGHSKPGVFTKADEDAVVAIAQHAAIAIENARLYEEQRRARVAAEQARDRTERLQRLTLKLSRALGGEDAARIVIDEVRDVLGVQAGGVVLFDEAGQRIDAFIIEGDLADGVRLQAVELDLHTAAPIFDAVRQGELVWVVGADEIDRRYPHLASLRATAGHRTWGGLPITFEGRTLGAIGFGGERERELAREEREFLLALGRQCGQALERARLHEASTAAYAEAERANRVKDEFLAMLGHELRNPLSPILSAIQLMRLRGETSSTHEQQIIERQVNHLIHLVDDLLDISRITRGKVELSRKPQKLGAIVANAVETVSPSVHDRGHTLRITLPHTDVWVDIDEVRISQVLTNLLTNAVKYSPRGGCIEVVVEPVEHEVEIRVRDHGVGISAELLPRVFDLFVQGYQGSERSNGGLGVGLALVRSLVEMHGGSVTATSEGAGQGSEFAVRLPLLESTRARRAALDPEGMIHEPARAPARKILVVDDNEDAALLISELLRSLGHEVRVAHDGLSALALEAEFAPDIAILDIGLPGLDGYQLASTIRGRRGNTVRLMAVTGYGQHQDIARAEHAGFDAHFVKPVPVAKLLTEIDQSTKLV